MLANQVASIPNNVLIWTVAVGVGVFLALAVLRIFHRASLAKCLLIAYALLFALTLFSPKDFLAVAFDGADHRTVYHGAGRRRVGAARRAGAR